MQKARKPSGRSQSVAYSKELAPRAKSSPNPAPKLTATIGLQVMPQVEPTAAPSRLYARPMSAPSSVHKISRDSRKLFIGFLFEESGIASGLNYLYAPRPTHVPVKVGDRGWISGCEALHVLSKGRRNRGSLSYNLSCGSALRRSLPVLDCGIRATSSGGQVATTWPPPSLPSGLMSMSSRRS